MQMIKIGLIAVLLALQFKLWFGNTGILEQRRTQSQIQDLIVRNEKLVEENQQVGVEIDFYKKSRQAVEAKARRELGLVREGERFFYYKGKKKPG